MRIIKSFLIIPVVLFIISITTPASASDIKSPHILATTLPIYLITKNVTAGIEDIDVELLIPAEAGCPHDYALTPRDMKKISKANILIINGLGLEEFIGAPLDRANPNIEIIDSSAGITDTLHYTADEEDHEEDTHDEEEEEHHHAGLNPHLFVSPKMNILLAKNIAHKLSEVLPSESQKINTNTDKYISELKELADKLTTLGKSLKNNRVLQPHGAFDYFARDSGLEIVATLQPHGAEPSAARMIKLIKIIKDNNVGAIIIEPQYSSKVAHTLSKETGIPLIEIDPVASGREDSPIDLYITVMNNNLEALQSIMNKE